MNFKSKLFLFIVLVFICVFSFGIVCTATTYTVGGANSDFSAISDAEAIAQNGDTIIIEGDITSDVNLTKNKSLNFVLKGNLLGGFRISYSTTTAVQITFRTEGIGNKYIKLIKSCDSSQGSFGGGYGNNLNTRYDISFIGTPESKIIVDGSSCAHSLNTSLNALVLNLYNTEFTGFKRGFKASTLNLYDGSSIHNNTTSDSLFTLNFLNMFAGEICDNTSNAKLMFNLKNMYMYGGVIKNNMLTSQSAVAFMGFEYQNENVYRLFDGSIFDNYIDSTATPAFLTATKYNSNSMINKSVIGVNYYYNATDSNVSPTEITSKIYNNFSYGDIKYAVIFKNSDGSLISAYASHKGPFAQNYSIVDKSGASATITVPSNIEKWSSRAYYCDTVSVDISKHSTYYASNEHIYSDDLNCETALYCNICGCLIMEALTHDIDTSFTFPNGYSKTGLKVVGCTREGCEQSEKTVVPALFESYGFSVDEKNVGITYKTKVNYNVINDYKAFLDSTNDSKTAIDYGIFVAIDKEEGKPINSNCEASSNYQAVVAKATDTPYSILHVKICGIDDPEKKLNCGAFIIINGNVSYINHNETSSYAKAITYNSLLSK